MKKRKLKIFENIRVLVIYCMCNLLTLSTIVAVIIITINSDDKEFAKLYEHIGLCILAVLFFNIPLFARMKFKLRVPPFLQITVTIFALAHFIFGEIYRFYDSSIIFDKILHTISGVMFGIYGFSLVNSLNNIEKPLFKLSPFFIVVFSFCFSLAIGYIWELLEYAVDSIFKINAQRWQDGYYLAVVDGEEKLISNYSQGSGLKDTMGDMIVNMIGAAGISVLAYIWLKKKSIIMEKILIKKIDLTHESHHVTPEIESNA